MIFCSRCGTQLNEGSAVCWRCGSNVIDQQAGSVSPKSRLAAALLAYFLGVFGAHRFYVGRIRTAIMMLVTYLISVACLMRVTAVTDPGDPWRYLLIIAFAPCVAVLIWAFFDFVVVLAGGFKDSHGRVIKKW